MYNWNAYVKLKDYKNKLQFKLLLQKLITKNTSYIIFFECCDSYNSSFCSFASKKARIHKVTLATHHPIPCKKPITKTTSNQSFITQPFNVVKANNKNMLFILYTISTKPQTPRKHNYKITTQTDNFRNLLHNSA
jgi:hypothetical protein